MIPRKPGDHIKQTVSGNACPPSGRELTAIWTPNEEHEAMRDLIRVRKQTPDALKVAKQQLLSFLKGMDFVMIVPDVGQRAITMD